MCTRLNLKKISVIILRQLTFLFLCMYNYYIYVGVDDTSRIPNTVKNLSREPLSRKAKGFFLSFQEKNTYQLKS